MTVSELKAILDTLPDDMPVRVNHATHNNYDPDPGLFVAPSCPIATGLGRIRIPSALMIVPSLPDTLEKIAKRSPHWRHINKQEAGE